jgi:nucleotide-binding universal stress UspA family protein
MYRRILVPLDGTPFGDHALPYAVEIAVRTGAALELVHVHHHREHDTDLAAMPQYQYQKIGDVDHRRDQEERLGERRELEQKAADIEIAHNLRVGTRVLAGRTADAVAREAQDVVADLIVMASHAREGLARLRYGHLAHELICNLNVPAICVRPDEAAPPPAETPRFRRVLVPLDGSEFSEQVLEPLAPLLGELDAQATLLHVRTAKPMMASGMTEAKRNINTRDQAIAYLEEVADRYRGRMPDPVLTALEDEQPANVIASLLSVGEYDMAAMVTHGRSGLSRLLLGSVAEEVLHHVGKPIMLYRPRLASVPAGELAEAFRIYGD